jgi:hypothetical protein
MRPVKLFFRLLIILLLAITIGNISLEPLRAATTFNVNASFDAADTNPGDGFCAISGALGGACTLRAAIQEANLLAGADTINMPAGSYLFSVGGKDFALNQADKGDLDITDSAGLTINASGVTLISQILQGGDAVFSVALGAKATINGLTIQNTSGAYSNSGHLILTNGKVQNGVEESFGPSGSGVTNLGILEVTNFTFVNLPRSAINALFPNVNPTPDITLTNVKVSNMKRTALFGAGDWEIVNSTIENSERGIQILSAKSLTISGSTISGNTQIGGIFVGTSSGINTVVNIRNSTISGNTTTANSAGGLDITGGPTMQATLNNVTIVGNKGPAGVPGGLRVFGNVTIKNSILAGNIGADCSAPGGANQVLHSQGFNLIGNTTGCVIDGNTATNIVGVSPQLGNLQFNGGPTQTHAPLAGSPVVNAGSTSVPGSGGTACEAKDQIGTNRPQGGRCDIGAVEGAFGVATPPSITSLNPNNKLALGPAFSMAVQGANFDNLSVVRWQGFDRPTAFSGAPLVTASIPPTDLVVGGIIPVTVFNPVQGRTSNSVNFIVNNPVPTISSINPKSVRAATLSVRLTVTGTNFVPTSEVLKDGQPLPTTFVSNTTLQAQLGKTNLGQVGQFAIKVRNPAPGGGTSATFVTFQVGAGGVSNIGEGAFSANVQKAGLQSTLILTWTHPTDWRLLNEMDVRLVDGSGNPVLWLGFDGDFGTKGALLIRDANGLTAGLAIPGDQTVLGSRIATLDVANSGIDGPPGERVVITYAVIFDSSATGETYNVELFASNDNNDGHGFEAFGSLTVPGSKVFLPQVVK